MLFEYFIGKYNLKPALELQVPDEVIFQNDFSGFCVAHSNLPPRVLAHNCHITKRSTVRLQGSCRINFSVRNVTTPCRIHCHLIQSRLQKLVNVLGKYITAGSELCKSLSLFFRSKNLIYSDQCYSVKRIAY